MNQMIVLVIACLGGGAVVGYFLLRPIWRLVAAVAAGAALAAWLIIEGNSRNNGFDGLGHIFSAMLFVLPATLGCVLGRAAWYIRRTLRETRSD
jgi:hypothetical protein